MVYPPISRLGKFQTLDFVHVDAKEKISKNKMALLLKTSRSQVDRLLNANDDITLSSLQKAAALVGRRVMIELV